jgi:hypothetical protein
MVSQTTWRDQFFSNSILFLCKGVTLTAEISGAAWWWKSTPAGVAEHGPPSPRPHPGPLPQERERGERRSAKRSALPRLLRLQARHSFIIRVHSTIPKSLRRPRRFSGARPSPGAETSDLATRWKHPTILERATFLRPRTGALCSVAAPPGKLRWVDSWSNCPTASTGRSAPYPRDL